MKRAFIYVGHANWGKSETLRHITEGRSHKKSIEINGIWFWVRKMSNDDNSLGLLNAVRDIRTSQCHHYIFAYCPKQETDPQAMEILSELQTSCQLFFLIQERKYNDPRQIIPENEIAYLRSIGQIEILSGNPESNVRADRFLSFIQRFI